MVWNLRRALTIDEVMLKTITLLLLEVHVSYVPCHLYDSNHNEKADPEENPIEKRHLDAQHSLAVTMYLCSKSWVNWCKNLRCCFNHRYCEFSAEPYLRIHKRHLRAHTSHSHVKIDLEIAKQNYSSEVHKRLEIVNTADSSSFIFDN